MKDPGLHRSLMGDFISTSLSGMVGSVPTTTYGENIGVMAVTGVYSVQVIAGAAIISILCSFLGQLSALITTIPGAVTRGCYWRDFFLTLWNDWNIRTSDFS